MIAELRRKLRAHPCHSCPDREEHARYAERYFRLKREAEGLERQVGRALARHRPHLRPGLHGAGRTRLPGRRHGDRRGQAAGGLYSELDLLAAECLRRGLWDGLNPAELAACVSVLTFESRQQPDDAGPARLPKGPVRDVLADMTRTWAELDQLETAQPLSFLREPDLGFVWAAYRWVRGPSWRTCWTRSPA